MSRITRVTAIPFGGTGTTDDFETFGSTGAGSTVYSKDIAAIQATSEWGDGWRPALITGKAPVMQDMNAKMLVDSNFLCYMFQEGVPEYDSATTYYIGSIVKNLAHSGYVEFYASIVNTNTGNALPTRVDDAHWSFLYAIRQSTGQIIFGKAIAFAATGTNGIVGTVTNDAAASGMVGQYVESVVATVAAPTSGQWGDITSISLDAGDWDVTWLAIANPGTTLTDFEMGISSTSGNNTTGLVLGSNKMIYDLQGGGVVLSGSIPSYRVSLSGTTTIYAKVASAYGSTLVVSGRLSARRMR